MEAVVSEPTFAVTDADRELIERILTRHTVVPFAYGQIRLQLVFDRPRDSYILLLVGWEGYKRVHGPLIHVDLRNGKFYIEYDGTEDGIATELLDAGIPKERIVQASQHASRRRYSEFAFS